MSPGRACAARARPAGSRRAPGRVPSTGEETPARTSSTVAQRVQLAVGACRRPAPGRPAPRRAPARWTRRGPRRAGRAAGGRRRCRGTPARRPRRRTGRRPAPRASGPASNAKPGSSPTPESSPSQIEVRRCSSARTAMPLGVVVGGGDLRGGPVHDLPHPGADVEQPVVVDVQVAGLRDQRLPDQPAADPERAEQVVDRQALLGAPLAGGARGVVVLLAEAGLGAADELQDPGQVVVAGAPQVVVGDGPAAAVAGVALLDGGDQLVGERARPGPARGGPGRRRPAPRGRAPTLRSGSHARTNGPVPGRTRVAPERRVRTAGDGRRARCGSLDAPGPLPVETAGVRADGGFGPSAPAVSQRPSCRTPS